MDERELEARIGARLHARFDGPQPPAALRAAVQNVPASAIRSLPTSVPLAWLAAAALVVALAAGFGVRWIGPGAPLPTVEATASPMPNRTYTVLPAGSGRPSKAATDLALEVFSLRLRALGIDVFSSAAGDAITFELPGDVDDAAVRAVLSANGELSFVPLPPEDYGDGGLTARIGEPLPKAEPELFGADDIASSGVATEAGVPARVHFELKPAAASALDVYTTGNVGQTFAVLLDGRVALLPMVTSPISDGRLEISGGLDSGTSFLVVAAVVTSGALPEAWRDPTVR